MEIPITFEQEKLSQKQIDIFCREVMEKNTGLKEEILKCMHTLQEKNVPMPLIHITSSAIQIGENKIDTDFVKNIMNNGFKKKDTNVGVFLERSRENLLASPSYFELHPEEFVKAIKLFVKRYIHHGFRVNKNILGELKNDGVGIPEMMIIEGSLELQHGSDYDDHYILKEGASPDKIIGSINLGEHNRSFSSEDIDYIASKFIELLYGYYTK